MRMKLTLSTPKIREMDQSEVSNNARADGKSSFQTFATSRFWKIASNASLNNTFLLDLKLLSTLFPTFSLSSPLDPSPVFHERDLLKIFLAQICSFPSVFLLTLSFLCEHPCKPAKAHHAVYYGYASRASRPVVFLC